MKIIEFLKENLKGKKTYACVALGIIVVGLSWAGKIDSATRDSLLGLLGFGSVAALRASIQ